MISSHSIFRSLRSNIAVQCFSKYPILLSWQRSFASKAKKSSRGSFSRGKHKGSIRDRRQKASEAVEGGYAANNRLHDKRGSGKDLFRYRTTASAGSGHRNLSAAKSSTQTTNERKSYRLAVTPTTLLHQTLDRLRNRFYQTPKFYSAGQIWLLKGITQERLSELTLAVRALVDATPAFNLAVKNETFIKSSALSVQFAEGREEMLKLYWAILKALNYKPKNRNFEPSVKLSDRIVKKSLRNSQARESNHVLKQLAEKKLDANVLFGEGGILTGVATSLTLFESKGDKIKFVRRYLFRDVPSHGWENPASVMIPSPDGDRQPKIAPSDSRISPSIGPRPREENEARYRKHVADDLQHPRKRPLVRKHDSTIDLEGSPVLKYISPDKPLPVFPKKEKPIIRKWQQSPLRRSINNSRPAKPQKIRRVQARKSADYYINWGRNNGLVRRFSAASVEERESWKQTDPESNQRRKKV